MDSSIVWTRHAKGISARGRKFALVAGGALLAALSASASGTYNNHKTDGTNVWIGAASGGSMKDLSNWKAVVGGVEYTDATSVSNLMMKHVTLDIRGLAHGAVLTNDINFGNTYNERSSTGYTMIAGIVYDGQDGDEVSFVKADGCKGLFFTAPSYLDILGGMVVWNGDGGENYPYKKPVKRGAGVFRFASAAGFWESDGTVQLGTLAFTNNVSTHNYVWRVDDGATLKVEAGTSGSRFGSLYTSSSAHSAARLEIDPGATCEIVGGWNTVRAERQKFYGTLAGEGTFSVNCGAVQEFLKSDHAGAMPFTGLLSPWIGDIAFGTAAAPLGVERRPGALLDLRRGRGRRHHARRGPDAHGGRLGRDERLRGAHQGRVAREGGILHARAHRRGRVDRRHGRFRRHARPRRRAVPLGARGVLELRQSR